MTAQPAVAPQDPVRALITTEEAFCAWLGRAMPGQRLEYHRGHLVTDRSKSLSPFGDRQRRELGRIADRALALAAEGRLILVQHRVADGRFSYRAMKAAGRRQPMTPRGRLRVVEAG